MIGQPVLAEVVTLALEHGHFVTRVASTDHEATSVVADWSPHLVVLDVDIDMDIDIEGNDLLKRFAIATVEGDRLPLIALTRRGDLESRLSGSWPLLRTL